MFKTVINPGRFTFYWSNQTVMPHDTELHPLIGKSIGEAVFGAEEIGDLNDAEILLFEVYDRQSSPSKRVAGLVFRPTPVDGKFIQTINKADRLKNVAIVFVSQPTEGKILYVETENIRAECRVLQVEVDSNHETGYAKMILQVDFYMK
jgi:hypothetical protein